MPHDRSIGELMAIIEQQFDTALATGFDAIKMEVLFGDLVSDAELVEQIKIGRRMLGDRITMALDFGYRWKSWADAAVYLLVSGERHPDRFVRYQCQATAGTVPDDAELVQ